MNNFLRLEDILQQEPSIYMVLWIFIIGSVMGYVIETLWYRMLRGKWICRKGVIYGPFSPIYGLAMAGFVCLIRKLGYLRKISLFLIGTVLGSVFEYICGYLQEKILHTKSWDYSGKPFQIKGRICLEFAIYWGIAAVVAVYVIYPLCYNLFALIPEPVADVVSLGIGIYLLYDCLISGIATIRQRERREGVAANCFWRTFFDKYYPDERLEKIYTEIRVLDVNNNEDDEMSIESEIENGKYKMS